MAGEEISYKIFSGADPEESKPAARESEFSLEGKKTKGGTDGRFDTLTLLFICLAVLFVADWGVYCYEKYQLR